MIGAGILDGDLVAVHRTGEARKNQVMVARLDDEVTVKRYRPAHGGVWLVPENEAYSRSGYARASTASAGRHGGRRHPHRQSMSADSALIEWLCARGNVWTATEHMAPHVLEAQAGVLGGLFPAG